MLTRLSCGSVDQYFKTLDTSLTRVLDHRVVSVLASVGIRVGLSVGVVISTIISDNMKVHFIILCRSYELRQVLGILK